jgi:hypothetical protein
MKKRKSSAGILSLLIRLSCGGFEVSKSPQVWLLAYVWLRLIEKAGFTEPENS